MNNPNAYVSLVAVAADTDKISPAKVEPICHPENLRSCSVQISYFGLQTVPGKRKTEEKSLSFFLKDIKQVFIFG